MRNKSSDNKSIPSVPDFETFKKQMEAGNDDFNPFGNAFEKPVSKSEPIHDESKKSATDDDLGFDVDELVKKIDAKIAELEEEEKRQNEEKKKAENKEIKDDLSEPDDKKETVASPVEKPVVSDKTTEEVKPVADVKPLPSLNLDDSDDDDDFFDDFFDN